MRKIILLFLCFAIGGNLLAQVTYYGKITDSDNIPLMGVTVLLKGTAHGVSSDENGNYSILIPEKGDYVLKFSYIGFDTQQFPISPEKDKKREINVKLKESINTIEEVVITGIIPKAKNSFTGSQTTITQAEISMAGTKNILSSLESFIPGVEISKNNLKGSDPNNSRPEINIRGRSSFEGSSNLPLFIVDDAEVSVDYIYDMDINDIESATILKDASASALYGAKAAAGVIVIQTKTPQQGKLRFNYNGTTRYSFADLSDYNLLSPAQKLEYEQLAGLYTSSNAEEQYNLDAQYAKKFERISQGINTNWLRLPLQIGVSQNHNIGVDGGDKNTRYSANLRYGKEEGVMKGSERNRLSSMFKLSYSSENSFSISNTANISFVDQADTPFGSFSNYVVLNPYDTPYDSNGELLPRLSFSKYNPLYESSLRSFSKGKSFSFLNTVDAKVWIKDNIRINGTLSIQKQSSQNDIFTSPLSKDELEKSLSSRGRYQQRIGNASEISGKLLVTMNQYLTPELFMTTTLGVNADSKTSESVNYTTVGYSSDKLNYPTFANRYADGVPFGSDNISRNIGLFANANFIHDGKYFLDVIYRYEGSSKFGKNKRFAPFWSIGGGWNINNEKFLKDTDIQTLKLRASVGYLGNINFSPYQAITMYKYNNSQTYNERLGALPITIGNNDLKWERTLSNNIGIDFALSNRWDFSLDVYLKNTDNLLLSVTKAPSIGVQEATENIGSLQNKGVEFKTRYTVFQNDDWNWSVSGTYSYNKNIIKSISNALKERNLANAQKESRNPIYNPIYEENESLTALKVVRSAGIDPATGKEILIDKNGNYTFTYNPLHKVVVGDTAPLGYGSLSTYLTYKGFFFSANMMYSFGGMIYNQTLASRVEGSDPHNNADVRVFESRWKNPGDFTKYKDIRDTSIPNHTTRFVEVENYISLKSLSVGYEFPTDLVKQLLLKRAHIELLTNDVFHLSTVKQERGLEYPFARSCELSLRVSF